MTLNSSSYLLELQEYATTPGSIFGIRKEYNIIKKSHHFFLQPSKPVHNSTSHGYLLR